MLYAERRRRKSSNRWRRSCGTVRIRKSRVKFNNKWKSLIGSVRWIKHRWWPAAARDEFALSNHNYNRSKIADPRHWKPIKFTRCSQRAVIGRLRAATLWLVADSRRPWEAVRSMSYKQVPLATATLPPPQPPIADTLTFALRCSRNRCHPNYQEPWDYYEH